MATRPIVVTIVLHSAKGAGHSYSNADDNGRGRHHIYGSVTIHKRHDRAAARGYLRSRIRCLRRSTKTKPFSWTSHLSTARSTIIGAKFWYKYRRVRQNRLWICLAFFICKISFQDGLEPWRKHTSYSGTQKYFQLPRKYQIIRLWQAGFLFT